MLSILRNISLKVTSVLRSKTYYSVKDIPCVPNQALLTENGFLRLYDDVCKVGVSKFKNLEWIYVPTHGYQNENGPPDKPQSDKMAAWTSSFRCSVSPEHRLQPTFCTKHVARSYSPLFRIHIRGAYVEMVDCEVPLRVVFPPSKILDPHSSADEAAPLCLGSAAIRRKDIVRRHIDMAIAGSDACPNTAISDVRASFRLLRQGTEANQVIIKVSRRCLTLVSRPNPQAEERGEPARRCWPAPISAKALPTYDGLGVSNIFLQIYIDFLPLTILKIITVQLICLTS